jgi:hypothetical protein
MPAIPLPAARLPTDRLSVLLIPVTLAFRPCPRLCLRIASRCFVLDGPAAGQGSRPVVLESQHYTPWAGGGRGFPSCQHGTDGSIAFSGEISGADICGKQIKCL